MDTIFVKNVKDEGPAHRAGLRTGELARFPGSLHPLALFLPRKGLSDPGVRKASAARWHPDRTGVLRWALACSHVVLSLVPRRPAGEGEWGKCHWEDLFPGHSSDPEQVSPPSPGLTFPRVALPSH